MQEQAQRNNLSSIFDIGDIPSDTQLRELLDGHDCAPVSDLYRQWFVRLQRSKQLDSYRVFGEQYLVTVDGSEYFNTTPLYAADEAPQMNFVEFHLYDANGKRTRHFSWVTDRAINKENVEEFVRAARSRWKIENENFNTLKNHASRG